MMDVRRCPIRDQPAFFCIVLFEALGGKRGGADGRLREHRNLMEKRSGVPATVEICPVRKKPSRAKKSPAASATSPVSQCKPNTPIGERQ
jgi:hypothetical protein